MSKQSEFHLKKRKDPKRGNSFSAKKIDKILADSEKIEAIPEGNAEQIESGDCRPQQEQAVVEDIMHTIIKLREKMDNIDSAKNKFYSEVNSKF